MFLFLGKTRHVLKARFKVLDKKVVIKKKWQIISIKNFQARNVENTQ